MIKYHDPYNIPGVPIVSPVISRLFLTILKNVLNKS